MTFQSSINKLNYFKIVILIYTDIVLITQAEIKALTGADDVELNRAGVPLGPAWPVPPQPEEEWYFSVMNWQHAQT